MLDPKIEDKLERIRALVTEREEIDAELQSLLGGGSHVARVSSKPGAMIMKVKGQRICSVCHRPGHNAKTCTSGTDTPVATHSPSLADCLSEDQFDEIKHLQRSGELISREYADENGLPLREVNTAIASRNYDEYRRKRTED